jgi:hypothetical protein
LTGGGTMQARSGEIEYCGIDIDLFDVANGVPFICDFLTQRGAPRGSKLQYESEGQQREVLFGAYEGLAIYLNGTELPAEVYEQYGADEVVDEINRRLGHDGQIQGHWQGPTETAIYLYGPSADKMHECIAEYLATCPLCQRAKIERIA